MTETKRKELIQRINLLIDDLHQVADMTIRETDGPTIYGTHLREIAELSADWRHTLERDAA